MAEKENSLSLFDKVSLLAELEDETCGLKHHEKEGVKKAVDWLVLSLPEERTLTIPICEDCALELNDESSNWTLCFCLRCLNSQWICHEVSKLSYENRRTNKKTKILWLGNCPVCSNKEEKLKSLTFG